MICRKVFRGGRLLPEKESQMWNLNEFLKTTGAQIAEQISARCNPRADANTLVHPAVSELLRRPLPSQSVVIHGMADYLTEEDEGFVFADMGSGKTLMTLAILHLLNQLTGGKYGNWIIVCPPHLLSTWIEEVSKTLPSSRVKVFQVGRVARGEKKDQTFQVSWNKEKNQVEKIGPGFAFSELKNREFRSRFKTPKLNLWVISRESLKLGAGWRPAIQKKYWPDGRTLAIEYDPGRWRIAPNEFVDIQPGSKGGLLSSIALPTRENGELTEVRYETTLYQSAQKWLEDIGFTCFHRSQAKEIKAWIVKNLSTRYTRKDFSEDTRKWEELNPRKREFRTIKVSKSGNISHFNSKTKKWTSTSAPGKKQVAKRFQPFWQNDEKGIRRWGICDFITQHLRGWFSGVVFDEGHEINNIDSAQGLSGLRLAQACKKSLTLTGTATNGTSEALWSSFYRCGAKEMEEYGYGFPSDDNGEIGRRRFSECYGIIEGVTLVEKSQGVFSKATQRTQRRLVPGIMPGIHTLELDRKVFIERSAFVTLDMISQNLPSRTYETLLVEEEEEQRERGRKIREAFKAFTSLHRERFGLKPNVLLPMVLTNHLDAPDHPVQASYEDLQIVNLPPLEKEKIYPKEAKYLEVLKNEFSEGRKVLTYVHFVNKGIIDRLQWLLDREGIRYETLLSDEIPAKDRKAWFQDLPKDVNCVLVNPSCIQTGLTLLDFPTIYVYQSGTNVITAKQSEARSYRIGARYPVRIFYSAYRGTIQESILGIMGKRRVALEAFQGIFTPEMAFMGDGRLSMVELGRMLIENRTVEGAGEVWKQLSNHGMKKKLSTRWQALDELFEEETDTKGEVAIRSARKLF